MSNKSIEQPKTDRRVAPPRAYQQVARSIVGLLLIGALTAVSGPYLSYRSDLAELESLTRRHVVREAGDFAEALAARIQLIHDDLERLAQRPEIDPRAGPRAVQESLLSFALEGSVHFPRGVAVLDAQARPVWSSPAGLLDRETGLRTTDWFQRVLSQKRSTVGAFEEEGKYLVVAVPIIRDQSPAGAVIGLMDASASTLPSPPKPGETQVVTIDAAGRVLLPGDVPDWARRADFSATVASLLDSEGGSFLPAPSEHRFAAARMAGDSGLTVVLAADLDAVSGGTERRFLWQMVLLAVLQFGVVGLVAYLFRRVSMRFFELDRAADETARLVSLGTASSLIAHEVKNALNGLKVAASLIQTGGDTQLGLRTIRAESDRLTHLSTLLLRFGKPAEASLRRTDVSTLLRDSIEVMRFLPGAEEVSFEEQIPKSCFATCDPLLFATAVQNLIRNAVEACVAAKDSGRVSQPVVRINLETDDHNLRLTVADNAGGVDPFVAGRLFEPFVSGKATGIGLGLAMSRQAMVAHQGSLQYEPADGGSRFVVRIPRTVQEVSE